MPPVFKPIADSAVLIEFENRISELINDQVLALLLAIENSDIEGIIEAVPSYCTLLVYYDPLTISFEKLTANLESLAETSSGEPPEHRLWQIPVWYGGPTALDLDRVADHNKISVEEVIEIHSSSTYRVYLVGFAPGWTFLGGLDERLHTPRLESPRAEVPAGSISIAGQQGLICGPAMPSGWNLIGQTPERTWAPEREEPFFIKPGDEVQIRRIDEAEFNELVKLTNKGKRVAELSSASKNRIPETRTPHVIPKARTTPNVIPKARTTPNVIPAKAGIQSLVPRAETTRRPKRHPKSANHPKRHPGEGRDPARGSG